MLVKGVSRQEPKPKTIACVISLYASKKGNIGMLQDEDQGDQEVQPLMSHEQQQVEIMS